MQAHLLKSSVLAGETVVGAMTHEFFSPGMSAILANAGSRVVTYDVDHTRLGFRALQWLFSTCHGLPIGPREGMANCRIQAERPGLPRPIHRGDPDDLQARTDQ